jgi:surface antigen
MRSRQQRSARSALTYAQSFSNDQWRNHSLDILGDDIELEIYQIAGSRAIEIRMAFCIRYDPYGEAFWNNFRNR